MVKEIVIVGGGFAGINLAKQMTHINGYHVTLVDKNNYNFFPPLLYQVATGFLEVSNISYPFRKFLHNKDHINFQMGELLEIIPEENEIKLSTGNLKYDYLVLATGTESNYFGMENIKRHALPMKTVDDAIELRNSMLLAAEEASRQPKDIQNKGLGNIVIAGGGPTGVEVAGMLAEMGADILKKDYPEFRSQNVQIYLVDAAPAVLSPMSEKAQRYTKEELTQMGVIVKLGKQVKDYQNGAVVFSDGESISTQMLIWTAGVTAKIMKGMPESAYGRGKRLIVDQYNKVHETANIFAIGDTSLQTTDPAFPEGHPQLAQVAIQQGKNLGKNFERMRDQAVLQPFKYNDKGTMAIIGRNKAVANLPSPKMDFTGWFAWIMWLFVHLFSLINYRNRIKTMYNWTAAYFTRDQALRMIIRPSEKHQHIADQNNPS